jgi:1-aminocyclopropane-1-carboxylate deaminase/D-cysteine desulfhydrase-like pyridoxal-dependent ACC family enzyme
LRAAVERLVREGRRPFEIPLGASTPLGALAFADAVGELLGQVPPPDAIVHSTSSGGTQAGLVAGCALHGLATRVLGVSADDAPAVLAAQVEGLLGGMSELLGVPGEALTAARPIEVDGAFVGEGYGAATPASREATLLAARSEALFLDPTYTAKAMAGLIDYVRRGRFRPDETVLFWHTGGQVGLFA